MNDNALADKQTKTLLVIYLMLLVWILLLKLGVQFTYMGKRNINLIPFGQPSISNGQPDFTEIILNVVIFIPLGIYAGVLFKRWTWRSRILFVLFVSLMIEALQYVLMVGAFDITDIITNVSGGLVGLVILVAVEKLFNSTIKAQKYLNIIATIGTVLVISLLVLLKLNMLPIRYQ